MDIIIVVTVGIVLWIAIIIEQNKKHKPNPVDESEQLLQRYFETNSLKPLFGNFNNFVYELEKLYQSNERFIEKNIGRERIGEAGYYYLPKLIKKTNFGFGYLMAYSIVFPSNIANALWFGWLSNRRNLINKFGPISSCGLYLTKVASPKTVQTLLRVLAIKAVTHDQKEGSSTVSDKGNGRKTR